VRLNKPKRLSFYFDPLSVKKYLKSYNDFLLIKHLFVGNRFSKFYYTKTTTRLNNISDKSEKMKEFKRKLNIHMYSDERFYKKFKIDILHFLGQIGSLDENSQGYKNLLLKLKESESLGRNIKEFKKKITIN
jgi:hypothetical protein